MTLLWSVYLATKNIEKKWTTPLHDWSLTVQQLYIKSGDGFKLDLAANSLVASPDRIELSERV